MPVYVRFMSGSSNVERWHDGVEGPFVNEEVAVLYAERAMRESARPTPHDGGLVTYEVETADGRVLFAECDLETADAIL